MSYLLDDDLHTRSVPGALAGVHRPARILASSVFVTAPVILALAFAWWWFHSAADSFQGDSSQLAQTVIVPTLDAPLPDGKSAIWCLSLQLAWNEFKSKVARGAFSLQGAEEVADRLNRAQETVSDVAPDQVYARAGLTVDGIQRKIAAEMQVKFPGVPLPDMNADQVVAVAFAYLKAGVNYDHRYLKNPDTFTFVDGTGHKIRVASFGIPKSNDKVPKELREQIRVLYTREEEHQVTEFALDLCRHSDPNQVVLARLNRKTTLAETLSYLQDKIGVPKATAADPEGYSREELHFMDRVIVPLMHWQIDHHFKDLELRPLHGAGLEGLYFDPVFQRIDFRLDPEGAQVSSSALLLAKSAQIPRQFEFDRPFLIYLKLREKSHPFFVMWVDNAELMCR
jgi:hypothetical protein